MDLIQLIIDRTNRTSTVHVIKVGGVEGGERGELRRVNERRVWWGCAEEVQRLLDVGRIAVDLDSRY